MHNKVIYYIKKALAQIIKLYKFLFLLNDYYKLNKTKNTRFNLRLKNVNPQIHDKTKETEFDLHYIYHPAWAARIISKNNPGKHIDISSTLHFSTIISAFVETDFYDFRPAKIRLENFKSKQANLTNLPFENQSIDSLSCMHTIEHIGLGRYGDPIDPDGDIKAINELKRVVATNGNLLIVVPTGKKKLAFNAHRIYSYELLMSYFKDFDLKDFSLISENQKEMIKNPSIELTDSEKYGCGCFWFVKK